MHKSEKFYNALPKHKAELIDGKMYVAGSLKKSAMTLGYMVENLGVAAVLELCAKDLLQEAVIEVYGRGETSSPPLADFEAVELSYYRPQKLATDLRLAMFRANGIYVSGGTTAVKLGEEVLMPDVYVITTEKKNKLTEYYLEGAPDLVIEVVHPYMRSFDYGIRLKKYAAAGLQEVWMLDYEKKSFEPYSLRSGKYELQTVSGTWYVSKNIPEIRVKHEQLYDSAAEFGIRPLDIFEVDFPDIWGKYSYQKGYGWGSVPFIPRFDLEAVDITFQEFISWGGEVKFEMIDGKPLFGGNENTTKEWLGLLMMTLGLKETVKYLPKEAWSEVL